MDNISLFENQITIELYPVPFIEIRAVFGKQLKFISLKAGEHLITAGKRTNHIYLLLQGAIRQYSVSKKGEEINFLFYFENDFVTDHRSFIDNDTSLFNFSALEDCLLISIDRNDLEMLKTMNPAWEKLHRAVNEKAIVRLYKRNELLLSNSP
jgi:CRP-like cAMP-binding protein